MTDNDDARGKATGISGIIKHIRYTASVKAPKTSRTYKKPLLWGGIAVAIVALGYLHYTAFTKEQTRIDTSCLKDYPLTSRSLDCGQHDQSEAHMQVVQALIEAESTRHIREGHAARVSVWVRDLETRRWAASNSTELFAPASMLKVPIMIAYFKLAEIEPAILEQPLIYTAAEHLGDDAQDIPSESELVVGKAYSVERLIEDMIIHSDNNAMHVLIANINEGILTRTMTDLSVAVPNDTGKIDFVTSRSFANIFRSLYNSSYLNRAHSQKALDLLTHSKYKVLTRDFTAPTIVADKFGERVAKTPTGEVIMAELHDCGIVYAKPNPYSICIMTQGKSLDDLSIVIGDISAKIYKEMH